ncbi:MULTISPECIES: CRISPR-associated helicase Cas3' [Thermodesulfovibrio]|jgi:CRISPR-associated endonuclease/helicase Cas3|uniref:CRISPR-associated helicase Cas3' n=1 Tax=Thermodesulfovibrio TaxID=28261 RepID=UPI002601BDC8|nr:CRISPR-associated helicase Cas3' [Thermodesulfovibrio sp.]
MTQIYFYSHPEILLKDHLRIVGENAKLYVSQINGKLSELSELALIIGNCHDFGKFTSFFQNHLLGKPSDSRAHHSLLSAIFAAYIIKKKLEEKFFSNLRYKDFLPIISFLVVYRHHGDLKSPDEIIPRAKEIEDYPKLEKISVSVKEEISILSEQIKDINKNFPIIKDELISIGLDIDEAFFQDKTIIEIFKHLDMLKYQLLEGDRLESDDKMNLYFITLLLFSALIDADKKSAGRERAVQSSSKEIPFDLVDRYLREKFMLSDSKINSIRWEIYRRVNQKVNSISVDEQRIFTLTAPTGCGKTLTALSFALKLRDKINKETGLKPKIIYSLPFITIIEQNYNVFCDVLSLLGDDFFQNKSNYIIKHHHLADMEYRENDEYRPIEEALLLKESWDSEIIVTTFIQFLHSVIAYKNSFLKKFHNIAGSIIILDEVQNIPVEYWNLVDKVLHKLTEFIGCWVVLMTATKPLLLHEKAVELIDDNERYFRELNRVCLKPIVKEISTDEFIEKFKYEIENKATLIVSNTIAKSIEIYITLKGKLNYEGFTELEKENGKKRRLEYEELMETYKNKQTIFYLSTNITPLQRAIRIKILNELMRQGKKPILVSTQVVEAGVDLDFDLVFRDIGPLDSVIQVAGRCNRNYKFDKPRDIYILNLMDGKSEYVYGKIHLWIARELLKTTIQEKNFYELINQYFSKVKEKISNDKSKYILEAIESLNFYHSNLRNISDFQIISEKGRFVDIFVELDDNSSQIKDKFIECVLNQKDIAERKKSYLKLRRKFYEYVVSVRERRLMDNVAPRIEKSEFYFVPYLQLESYYDIETGYKHISTVDIL